MILTICLNPVLQKTIVLSELLENQVNRSKEYYFDISGKGINLSRVLSQLGEKVCHLTQIGGANRRLFLKMMKKENFKLLHTLSSGNIRSCYTLLNRFNHSLTEIVEEGETVDVKTEEKVLAKFNSWLPKCNCVIISGSKAPGFSDRIFPEMVMKAKSLSKLVILDYRKNDLINSLPFRPDFIKPNLAEFIDTFFPKENILEEQIKPGLLKKVKDKIMELRDKYNINIILTNGKKDILYTENNKIKSCLTKEIKAVNTIGCGDTFTAGFASAYLKKLQISEAVNIGIECAAKNAENIRPGCIE